MIVWGVIMLYLMIYIGSCRLYMGKIILEFFQHFDINLLSWTTRSPDLSSTEYVWESWAGDFEI